MDWRRLLQCLLFYRDEKPLFTILASSSVFSLFCFILFQISTFQSFSKQKFHEVRFRLAAFSEEKSLVDFWPALVLLGMVKLVMVRVIVYCKGERQLGRRTSLRNLILFFLSIVSRKRTNQKLHSWLNYSLGVKTCLGLELLNHYYPDWPTNLMRFQELCDLMVN